MENYTKLLGQSVCWLSDVKLDPRALYMYYYSISNCNREALSREPRSFVRSHSLEYFINRFYLNEFSLYLSVRRQRN